MVAAVVVLIPEQAWIKLLEQCSVAELHFRLCSSWGDGQGRVGWAGGGGAGLGGDGVCLRLSQARVASAGEELVSSVALP